MSLSLAVAAADLYYVVYVLNGKASRMLQLTAQPRTEHLRYLNFFRAKKLTLYLA